MIPFISAILLVSISFNIYQKRKTINLNKEINQQNKTIGNLEGNLSCTYDHLEQLQAEYDDLSEKVMKLKPELVEITTVH